MEQVHRNSKKRDAVLQVMRSTETHPDAEWVYEQLHDSGVSLTTVYRNISYFREQGLVKKVAVVNGKERFDAKMFSHPHFVCRKCGKVEDIDLPANAVSADKLTECGYVVEDCDMLFQGVCPECSVKND